MVLSTRERGMSRPRLLDLFCGAGGAAMGYHRAGFDVVGVDVEPQPCFPFTFVQADALECLAAFGPMFDAIHASPPCQFFTTLSARWRGKGTVADSRIDLLTPTLALIREMDVPWVVENVTGAASAMRTTLLLHGGMFGLRVHRPRLFESNVMILVSPAARTWRPVGVYGRTHDGRYLSSRNREQKCAGSLTEAHDAMGMDWADWHGTKEAIPPAYTEFIGHQLLAHASTHG